MLNVFRLNMEPDKRSILVIVACIGILVAYCLGSTIYYEHSISPKGILTVRDFFDRFGEPRSVNIVTRDGQSYYEFTGQLPSWALLVVPSAPPSYIFDEHGRYVAWCSDPGDTINYRQQWPRQNAGGVEISTVCKKFELKEKPVKNSSEN